MDKINGSLTVLCYHGVADGFDSQWVISEAEFEKHIVTLVGSGFKFCSPDEISSGSLDSTQKYCAITFDDGRIISNNSLRLMEEYQISATFFITTNFIDNIKIPDEERYCPFLSWDQIEDLIKRNHIIGAHTISHPNLCKLSSEQVLYEMKESKKILEQKYDNTCNHFAAPYGQINELILSSAILSQYKTISNTDSHIHSLPFSGNTIDRIPIVKSKNLRDQVPQIFDQI
jgi:peptidoglycan/xylan/chitin deacetylase (PgdA/CDA1 family)